MSLLEIEQRRSRRAQRKHRKHVERKHRKHVERKHKRRSALAAPLSMANDAQVLTFREWCRLNRISERTGRRILASGDGPIVTMLSARRVGITVGNNRRWQESRARGAA
jgi:hypothetical protein